MPSAPRDLVLHPIGRAARHRGEKQLAAVLGNALERVDQHLAFDFAQQRAHRLRIEREQVLELEHLVLDRPSELLVALGHGRHDDLFDSLAGAVDDLGRLLDLGSARGEGCDDGSDLVRVNAPHARVAQLTRGFRRGRRDCLQVVELGHDAV